MSAATPVTAVVPLRTGGKTRLSPTLGPEERSALAGAMLADVTGALRGAGLERIVVAAEGPAALAAAAALGLASIPDAGGGRGLDHALRHAAARLAPTDALLVVAADLPRLTAGDVMRVLDAAAPVVVAPTHDGGTGGLLRRPPDVIATAYGPDSARAHLWSATRAGVEARQVWATGFAHDVDTTADLADLPRAALGPATSRLVSDLALDRRAAG